MNIVVDSGKGGKDFIKKLKKWNEINVKFVKLFDNTHKLTYNFNKSRIKSELLKVLKNVSNKQVNFVVIACNSASSCILEILFKNKFLLDNIKIFEPITPMYFHIKERCYKNILIMSTPITQKIGWHNRLLKPNKINVKYLTFPLLASRIEYNNKEEISKSLKRISKKKDFLKISDCVVLGCTHFNIIKNLIFEVLKLNEFKGVLLDSNEILLEYFIRNYKENI